MRALSRQSHTSTQARYDGVFSRDLRQGGDGLAVPNCLSRGAPRPRCGPSPSRCRTQVQPTLWDGLAHARGCGGSRSRVKSPEPYHWSALDSIEAHMTKTELADKLNHLDPGATLRVQQGVLASLFGAGGLSKET